MKSLPFSTCRLWRRTWCSSMARKTLSYFNFNAAKRSSALGCRAAPEAPLPNILSKTPMNSSVLVVCLFLKQFHGRPRSGPQVAPGESSSGRGALRPERAAGIGRENFPEDRPFDTGREVCYFVGLGLIEDEARGTWEPPS